MRRSSHTISGSIRSAYCSLFTPWKSKHCSAGEREAVFHVVEDGVIDAVADPFRQIAVELLGQEEIGEPAVLRVEQVHILHGLVDHVIVFRLQLRAAVGEQELDEASTGT